MFDDLSLLLLAAAITFFAGAVLVGDRQFRNALFVVACLAFLGFALSLAMNNALLDANVRTMTLGR